MEVLCEHQFALEKRVLAQSIAFQPGNQSPDWALPI
jgi:hypothetical protein